MKKLAVFSLIAVFVVAFAGPALASISMSGQVTTRFQSLEADIGANEDLEMGFQDVLANLQIYGDVTAGVNAFAELDIMDENIEVYEAYITLDDLLPVADVKVGKFEVNFGNQSARGSRNADVQDNLLIGNPVVTPVASQTGVELSGLIQKVAWSLALTNGTDDDQFEEDSEMAMVAKVWGDLSPVLPGLSGAFSYYAVDQSDAATAADNLFTNDYAGAGYSVIDATVDLTTGPGADGDISAWQLDLAYDLAEVGLPAELALFYGNMEDGDAEFDYWSIEGSYQLTPRAYLAARYGEVEEDDVGEAIERLQVGLGYNLASGVLAKLEYVDQDPNDSGETDEFDGVVAELSVSF